MLELLQHPAIPLVTFFLGLLVGHRTALWRDMRQEFNDAAAPVRVWLLAEAREPSWRSKPPGLGEIDLLVQCMHFWRRKGFVVAWQRNEQARSQSLGKGPSGGACYTGTDAIKATALECLAYTRRW